MCIRDSFRTDERETEKQVDAALESSDEAAVPDADDATSGLWWESDPNLRDRYR